LTMAPTHAARAPALPHTHTTPQPPLNPRSAMTPLLLGWAASACAATAWWCTARAPPRHCRCRRLRRFWAWWVLADGGRQSRARACPLACLRAWALIAGSVCGAGASGGACAECVLALGCFPGVGVAECGACALGCRRRGLGAAVGLRGAAGARSGSRTPPRGSHPFPALRITPAHLGPAGGSSTGGPASWLRPHHLPAHFVSNIIFSRGRLQRALCRPSSQTAAAPEPIMLIQHTYMSALTSTDAELPPPACVYNPTPRLQTSSCFRMATTTHQHLRLDDAIMTSPRSCACFPCLMTSCNNSYRCHPCPWRPHQRQLTAPRMTPIDGAPSTNRKAACQPRLACFVLGDMHTMQ
jgi:hypothetical protein